jgi:hypothetical protein
MSRIRIAQSNFALGELSPLVAARSDIALYRNGAASLRNRRPLSTGGTQTRAGSRYVATLPASPARAFGFEFNAGQRYVIVLSDGRMDAWQPDGTACTALTSCPWTAVMLDELTWVQQGDTLLILHRSMAPQRILRTGATTFSRADMPVEVPPFARFEAAATTLAVSAVGAVGSTATATFSASYLTASMVGRWFRFRGKRATLTAYTSATQGTFTWQDVTTGVDTTATTDWQEQAWTPAAGYPGCGTILDGRLWLAASIAQPSAVWASKPGAPFNFDIGTGQDGDAIGETLPTYNRVRHLVGAERLLILTDGGIYFVPASVDRPVTPGTIAFRDVAPYGTLPNVRPARFDEATLFVDSTGRAVRELLWVDTAQSYSAGAVNLLADHLTSDPRCMAALYGTSTRPEPLAFVVNADGTLAVFHSVRSERVQAWMPWDTDGDWREVVALGEDLFAVAERGGAWWLERLDEGYAALDGAARATSATRTRTFTGFTHLAGETVGVVSRGHDLGDVTVSAGGGITLSDALPEVFEIEAGYRFTQTIRPMPVDVDLQDGPARGLMKRLLRALIQVESAGQFRVDGKAVLLTFQGDDFDTAPVPAVGIFEVRLLGVSRECQFDVTVVGAQRVTVLGITREVHVNG